MIMTPPVDGSGLDESFGSSGFRPGEVDELFEVLADRKRRSAIRHLTTAGGSLAFDELVADVARETTVEPVGHERRRDVAASLYHVHLPKLEAAGLVAEFDTDGAVRASAKLEDRTGDLIESL